MVLIKSQLHNHSANHPEYLYLSCGYLFLFCAAGIPNRLTNKEGGRVELLQHLYCTLVFQTSCHPHSSTFQALQKGAEDRGIEPPGITLLQCSRLVALP